MNTYSSETVNQIFQDQDFLINYNEYQKEKKIDDLFKFINGIELNKKYFRLEMNKKKGSRNKYRNMSEDTIALKEINSLLNKCTDKNFLSIRQKISEKIKSKDYLTDMIIESILEKCIIHTPYIPLYLDLINYLFSNNEIINDKIKNTSEKIHRDIENLEIKGESDYLRLCERNKKLDKQIGYSLLITELEKNKIIEGKIHPTIDYLIKTLSECVEDETKYKCVQCLYNILKSFYGDMLLPEGYNQKIKALINEEKTSKIKFKMMDILERK